MSDKIAQYGTTEEQLSAPGPGTFWQRTPANDGWRSTKPADLLKEADGPVSVGGKRLVEIADPADPTDAVTLKFLLGAVPAPPLSGKSVNGAQVVLAKYPIDQNQTLLLEIGAVVQQEGGTGAGPWRLLVFCARGSGDVAVDDAVKVLTPQMLKRKNVPGISVVAKSTEVWLVADGAAGQVWGWRARVQAI